MKKEDGLLHDWWDSWMFPIKISFNWKFYLNFQKISELFRKLSLSSPAMLSLFWCWLSFDTLTLWNQNFKSLKVKRLKFLKSRYRPRQFGIPFYSFVVCAHMSVLYGVRKKGLFLFLVLKRNFGYRKCKKFWTKERYFRFSYVHHLVGIEPHLLHIKLVS